MRSALITLLAVTLSIISMSAIVQANIHLDNIDKCMSSKYKTGQYEVINNNLYCKSSDNGMQMLKRREL